MAKAAKTKSDKDITSTVDQNSPAGLELQVRQPDALTVGNGTVFTRIGFSSITAMSVEAYLEKAKSLRGKAVQVLTSATACTAWSTATWRWCTTRRSSSRLLPRT